MDQDAFRSLLNQPREGGPSRSRGVFGRPPPKRTGWGLAPKDGKKGSSGGGEGEPKAEPSKPAFAPRAHQKKAKDKDAAQYKDRAALRRAGTEGEYKEVEQLLEDFEKRKAEAGDDADKVEAQRAYLGGDAEHSVLVKGLDYALLARRKAEIEAEKAAGMEDELEELGQVITSSKPSKSKGKDKEVDAKSSKFKSIAQRKEEAARAAKAVAEARAAKSKGKSKAAAQEEEERPKPKSKKRAPTPPPPPPPDPEDEEDIFADAGEYDLGAGREESDGEVDDDSEPEEAQMDTDRRGRQRYSSRSDSRDRYSSRSDSRGRYSSRSDSRDRYSRGRSYSRDARDRYDSYSRSRSRSRSRSYDDDRYDRRRRADSYDRRGRDRSYDRYDDRRDRRGGRWSPRSRSRSPDRRSRYSTLSPSRSRSPVRRRGRSASRTPTPPPRKRARTRSRSPTPLLQQTLPFERSPTPESDEDDGPVDRLQPLASSAIADVRSFLAADEAGAREDERRMRKARWRAAQGLAMQEGVTADMLRRDPNDKQKANREYQVLMNRIDKDDKGNEKGKGKGDKE